MMLLIPWGTGRAMSLWREGSWISTFKVHKAVFTGEPSGKAHVTLRPMQNSDLGEGKVCSMKGNIRNLWSLASLGEPTNYWNRWYSWLIHSSIDAMKLVARMRMHKDKILNYFTHRITNARAERINSKIALIEKMTYGFRNWSHLKTAIYFKCWNLDMSPRSHTQN